jgi:hypothetical protein
MAYACYATLLTFVLALCWALYYSAEVSHDKG